jgi:hypothetical protein
MAYLPGGNYHICAPIKVPSGSDFWFSGAGYATNILLHPGGKQQQTTETDGGRVVAVKETGKDGGGPSWVPPPSPTTMAHIEMDAAGSIGARVSGMFFSGNNWKDPLTNITHDVCSVRVSKTASDGTTPTASHSAVGAGPTSDVWLDWLFYDGAYNASACGVQVVGLGAGDVMRAGYLDMSVRSTHSL